MATLQSVLNQYEPIVDAKGLPSYEFQKFLLNFQRDAAALTPQLQALSTYNSAGIMTQISTTQYVGRTVTAGTGITVTNGSGVFGNPTIAITATAVTGGSYGSATEVATFTVNGQGQLTAAANTSIQITEGQVTNLTTDLAAKLAAANNLSDLGNAATARTNIGLGNVENTALSTWAGSTNLTTIGTITTGTWNAGAVTANNGDIVVNTAGNGFKLKEGSNARMGTATLVAGTVTVNNTSVTANTRIFYCRATTGGTVGHLSYTVIASTSFTFTSTSATDTSTINWMLIEPA